jgi:hypothetical protein
MFTWGSIILSVLRLLEWLIEEAQKHKWMTEGEKRQLAKGLIEITRKQEFANETFKQIVSLDDAKLDDLLRTLEGPGEAGGGSGQLLPNVQEDNSEQGGRVDQSIQGSKGKAGDQRS